MAETFDPDSSQRPNTGTESVSFADETNPKVVDLRNFGTVEAEDAVISIVVKIKGKALSGDFGAAAATASNSIVTHGTASLLSSITADTYRDVV
jgi:hypothetical protein